MEREIVLSSYLNKSSANNTPDNFVTNFDRPIILDSDHEYVIGLSRIINMSFTWFNVKPGYNNQKIEYSLDGGSNWKELALPSGVYNYINLDLFLKNETVIKSEGKKDKYPISLEFQHSTFKVILKDAENYGSRMPNLSHTL